MRCLAHRPVPWSRTEKQAHGPFRINGRPRGGSRQMWRRLHRIPPRPMSQGARRPSESHRARLRPHIGRRDDNRTVNIGRQGGRLLEHKGETMNLAPYHLWIVWIHVVGVILFLIGHGVSAAVAWRLRTERDPVAIRTLLDFSRRSLSLTLIGALTWLIGGILAGFSGNWWTSGQYW